MGYWIFQGNPDRFDIDQYLKSRSNVYWSVTREYHQKIVSVGDPVFIWRARGRTNLIPGVVAIGHITEPSRPTNEIADDERLAEDLWLNPEDDPTDMKAGISLDEIRLSAEEGMVDLQDVQLDSILKEMAVVKVRTGTNFPITYEQFYRLLRLWNSGDVASAEEAFGTYEASEGRIRLAVHKRRERDSKLVREAKRVFKEQHGSLYCEICGFSFESTYGELGNGYIEAHHIVPLGESDDEKITQIEDLMMVCSNCHRMIHKGDAVENLNNLKEMFQ